MNTADDRYLSGVHTVSYPVLKSLWNVHKFTNDCLKLNERKCCWNKKYIYLSKSKLLYILLTGNREMHTILDNRIRRTNRASCIKKERLWSFYGVSCTSVFSATHSSSAFARSALANTSFAVCFKLRVQMFLKHWQDSSIHSLPVWSDLGLWMW